ncbi:MAG: hypothetical protein A2758_02940 [Candidatus Zambryskibacteria bacterium RIFCSPHIGHO2_01_FULL_49_18]|uniref:Leucine--tRNA ligase n=2 Tax=Candidatus Zambryskiibacteriota TaxID=1817925 RepID=A0A1G2T3J6_9BACT|nr:MAG: hypothetical protein A2758_02940 [Candidatus Zambryskibacteria bacterium RIFCSPHIGHO2_01_FULL_49_18]OHB05030.1 MAG: hypothetical protein A3A26_00435 [Candidatus Zambryskibacteria bacterium RIFCSPLOWO2_01_FULL_47_14]
MSKEYDPKDIEQKWQKEWEKSGIYKTGESAGKPKFYILDMFPYVSGEGIHVGHPKGYIATDIVSRMKRMQGYNVLHPMGFDSFGLPAENYAIKTKTNPVIAVAKNIERYKKQLEMFGFDYDWDREVITSDPNFYKWTQWIFLKLLEKELAYESSEPVNWCPVDKTVLANEDVENGKCERCGAEVELRPIRQWVLRITDYADRLLEDLEELDWPESIKEQQRNWIGRSEGAIIKFDDIEVFTTRPDTIFGATFLVKAGKEDKFTDEYVTNPATKEKIPVWEAQYVMADYGTGAIMGVPADDERDKVFAEKHGLSIVENYQKAGFEDFGKKVTKYKLRDWVFSRQRYWGEPIPVVHDGNKVIPLTEDDLPLVLPLVEFYEPTGTEESPLANISEWINIKVGDKILRRESNTMPQWAGSSWYYLRYMDPSNNKVLVDKKREEYWNMVDLYVGGAEHATRHLIYARFWHKFLYDIGVVSTKEPFKRLQHVGLIIAEDGRKMSKRWGNIINPDDIIGTFGADSLRIYEMFMGPFDQSVAWNSQSIVGVRRFLEKVWRLEDKISNSTSPQTSSRPSPSSRRGEGGEVLMHSTIKKVSKDIEAMRFNTAVSTLMIFANDLEKREKISQEEYETLLKLLAPFAPHVAEEIWSTLGVDQGSIHLESWPQYDETKLVSETVTIVVQVNGKVRGSFEVPKFVSEKEIQEKARNLPEIEKWLVDKNVEKLIYVPGKLVNLVVSD